MSKKNRLLILLAVLIATGAAFANLRYSEYHAAEARKQRMSALMATLGTQALLINGEFSLLDNRLSRIQQGFEARTLTEFDLRDAYRPFYALDPNAVNNLEKWAREQPSSYVAQLAAGVYYMKHGIEQRGPWAAAKTNDAAFRAMEEDFRKSEFYFERSIPLTTKPFLSYFHEMNISQRRADARRSRLLLDMANQILPDNTLARDRYMATLMPRWGGSYEEAQQFIEEVKKSGIQEEVLHLEALLHDDRGGAAQEAGDEATAIAEFRIALTDAQKIGGTFRKDILYFANWICNNKPAEPLCH